MAQLDAATSFRKTYPQEWNETYSKILHRRHLFHTHQVGISVACQLALRLERAESSRRGHYM